MQAWDGGVGGNPREPKTEKNVGGPKPWEDRGAGRPSGIVFLGGSDNPSRRFFTAAVTNSVLARILAAAALTGAACSRSDPPAPPVELPVLGEIAAFALMDQDGQPFGRERLLGQVWVADFFFTSCPSICPQMTRALHRLGRELRHEAGISFLSISVDAATDRPEVLKRYQEQYQPAIPRWTLLTGDPEAIRRLCLESFKLAIGEEMDENGDITHSSRFVLIDRQGRVRTTYDSLDSEALERLRTDLQHLLHENNQ